MSLANFVISLVPIWRNALKRWQKLKNPNLIKPEEFDLWADRWLSNKWRVFVRDFVHEHYQKFTTWPASCNKHHSYVGGLFDHSILTAQLTAQTCLLYPNVDMNVAVSAALLHDVGKMLCYEPDGDKFKKNRMNYLHHHIPIGFNMLMSYIAQYDISDEQINNFGHCILAHHGRLEWHSPVEPQTPEALIVHASDMQDAYITSFFERGKLHGDD